jgi:hypothetical protein
MSPIFPPCVRHRRVAARRRPYPFLSAASCRAPLEARVRRAQPSLVRTPPQRCLSRRNKKIRPERMVRSVRATHPRAGKRGAHTALVTASRNEPATHPPQGAVPLRVDGAPGRGASPRGAPVAAARDRRARHAADLQLSFAACRRSATVGPTTPLPPPTSCGGATGRRAADGRAHHSVRFDTLPGITRRPNRPLDMLRQPILDGAIIGAHFSAAPSRRVGVRAYHRPPAASSTAAQKRRRP